MKATQFFVGLRPDPVVTPEGRDRVRRQGDPARRLRQDHWDDLARGRRPGGRAARAPQAARLAARRSSWRPGSAMHFVLAAVLLFVLSIGVGLANRQHDDARHGQQLRPGQRDGLQRTRASRAAHAVPGQAGRAPQRRQDRRVRRHAGAHTGRSSAAAIRAAPGGQPAGHHRAAAAAPAGDLHAQTRPRSPVARAPSSASATGRRCSSSSARYSAIRYAGSTFGHGR